MATVPNDKPKTRSAMGVPYRAREWRISPRATLLSARRYSVFVKVMKGALPMAALALAVVVLIYVLQPRETGRMALTFERLGRVEGDLAMVKPRLSGTDDDGLPYLVTAASAVQEERGSNRVRLETVVADISLKDGTALHVTATKGIVDTKLHLLDVSGGIRVTSQDGYDARTESAKADLKAGTLHGESHIVAVGKLGRITAERFTLDRETRQLRFSGNVQMLIYNSKSLPLRKTSP